MFSMVESIFTNLWIGILVFSRLQSWLLSKLLLFYGFTVQQIYGEWRFNQFGPKLGILSLRVRTLAILFLKSMSERGGTGIQRLWNWILTSSSKPFYVESDSFRQWFQKCNALVGFKLYSLICVGVKIYRIWETVVNSKWIIYQCTSFDGQFDADFEFEVKI